MRAPYWIALVLAATPALAQDAAPAPSGKATGRRTAIAPKTPPPRAPVKVTAAVPRRAASIAVPGLRELQEIRLEKAKDGEGQLRVNGVSQTIRPGMRLGSDIVKAVSADQLVLIRPETDGDARGEALVVVKFSKSRPNQVRIYATRDWTAVSPREVR